jgi:hypothetical protein
MTPDEIKTKLEKLKKEADGALIEKSKKEGQLVEIKSALKNTFNLDTFEDAEIRLNQLDEKIPILVLEIQTEYTELLNEFGLE